ncbi:multiple sugar transport system permease protein [Actinoplanes octamycinicus]|uniref:Multiple sugar transport system permease protein n=1 Tax=Actinoplanes octamycinicus TaxID=135948 RepID=A0A7W7H1K7_9ACTN|nr:sugar ABC transporter permease [Actinoplanes octamycinicus]MBB4742310.1 multiple sugar transport system permease protein [Actinoplanes octamycinicus]GIE59846.1 sugar ABC transporter permease [Actinoplanes octamycinicus]
MSISTAAAAAEPAIEARTRRPRRRLKAAERHEARIGALMVTPAVILLLLFFFIPVILCFILAFTNARLIAPEPAHFTGLDNFTRLFSDPVFWASLRNTFYFGLVVVPVQSAFALLLALLINVKTRGVNFFRTMYFIPVVTSIVVVSILWRFMYQPDGLVNSLLQTVTFNVVQGTDWLNNTKTAMPAIMFMSIWQAVGFHMVIWLSGLQTIPEERYEAADLDGATTWQKFRYVTWPGLRATRTFILVTITIAALSLFAQINVMTAGGPLNSTTTMVYQAVRTGYQQQQTAYASAISLIFFILVLTVSLVQRYLTRDKD